jgi:hypothetical protein
VIGFASSAKANKPVWAGYDKKRVCTFVPLSFFTVFPAAPGEHGGCKKFLALAIKSLKTAKSVMTHCRGLGLHPQKSVRHLLRRKTEPFVFTWKDKKPTDPQRYILTVFVLSMTF